MWNNINASRVLIKHQRNIKGTKGVRNNTKFICFIKVIIFLNILMSFVFSFIFSYKTYTNLLLTKILLTKYNISYYYIKIKLKSKHLFIHVIIIIVYFYNLKRLIL